MEGWVAMVAEYYDHVDQQFPYALIGPLRERVRELEDRANHYVQHVRMSDEDRQTMERVEQVLVEAREELERLRERSTKPVE